MVNCDLEETFANSAPKPKAELINNLVHCYLSVFAATTKTQVFKKIWILRFFFTSNETNLYFSKLSFF